MKCLRCDWHHDPEAGPARDQLLEHADTAGHPLCSCCHRSLKAEEPTVCEPCLTESRALLAGVSLMTDELPRHLGQLRGGGYDQVRGSSERPLTGGDVLVLGGPGSGGTGARVLRPGEVAAGAVQGIDGREHHQDNRDTNALSVAGVLSEWEDDWRHTRREPAAVAAGTLGTIRGAVGYLEVHARWAANEHPDFDGYLQALRQLHERLERATGRDSRPVRAEAGCFGCGGQLLREITDAGYSDKWTCQRCGDVYDWPRYVLALRGRLEASATGWSLPAHVASVLEVPFRTVQSWARRGMVATACLVTQPGQVGDKRMRVSYEEVAERVRRLAEAAQRREEKAEQQRQSQAS